MTYLKSTIRNCFSLGLFLSALFNLSNSWAHRPSSVAGSKIDLQKRGYKLVYKNAQLTRASTNLKIPYGKNSLPLPVKTLLPENPIGALPHQLESHSKPDYYHLGLDIRTEKNQELFSPVEGLLEAGFYHYLDAEDGSTEKLFLSYADFISGKGQVPLSAYYFELAITDQHGYRFELHHVDYKSLPAEIVQKILKTSKVFQSEFLGKVQALPNQGTSLPYHHVHYNIVSPEGLYLNPLHISDVIADNSPPEIMYFYSVKENKCENGLLVLDKIENETSKFIIVQAKDFIQGKHYSVPPTKLKAYFRNSEWEWDFTQLVADSNGLLPDIREIYLQHYCDLKGMKNRGSMSSRYYFKVPIPDHYNGPVLIEATDSAGNSSTKEVFIKTPSI